MTLLISIVDLFLIILLLRLLIKPNEAFFDPIYRLIFRLTDPVLRAASYAVRGIPGQVLLSLGALVVLRGILYASGGSISAAFGIGMSLLDLFKLLFQAYIVIWVVSVLSGARYPTSIHGMIDRAFHPFRRLSRRFNVRGNHHLFLIVAIFITYILLSGLVRLLLFQTGSLSVLSMGLVEAFLLVLGLFPFPGFFSLIIIIGALLSWVNPDPSNPIVHAIYGISEPLLQPFRRVIPNLGGLDISPIAALLCFQLIGSLGHQIIAGLVRQ